jgi:hypothetical protein
MSEFERYSSQAEIEEVVRRFEDCDYQPEEFFHTRHLTVAAWYFSHLDTKAAEERMRTGLQRFIRHHGRKGYHVTITEFWLRLVNKTLHEMGSGKQFASRVNQVVESLNNKSLIYEYYSREQLETPEAKVAWLEPNLKRLPDAV